MGRFSAQRFCAPQDEIIKKEAADFRSAAFLCLVLSHQPLTWARTIAPNNRFLKPGCSFSILSRYSLAH